MDRRMTWSTTILLTTLAALAALVLAPAAMAAAQPVAAPLNPDFVIWTATSSLRQALQAGSGHAFGERPAPHLVLSTEPAVANDLIYSSNFDLRTQSRLTPVKNQAPFGTCWSFATYGSLESMLMPGQFADFSEDNLVLTNGFDTGDTAAAKYDFGGNLWYSTAYLTRWSGPVLESQDGYGDATTPAGLSPAAHVQDISWYPVRSSATDNDSIKYALITYGAVYATMSWQGSTSSSSAYYNATTHAYYYDGADSTNHAVVIVGWDDAYPAANFATTPEGNGAFIVRNSWGSGWGESGYFYVSYYDTQFGRDSYSATFEGIEPVGNYDTVYQLDPYGDVSSMGFGALGQPIWGANKFRASSTGQLQAVGFYAEAPDTTYEVWEGPSTASLNKIASGTLSLMGFHTVTLPTTPTVTSGSDFVVAVKLTNPNYQWPLAYEYALAGYSSAATGSSGQSYYSSNGTSWTDLTSFESGANVCLKAYTAATTPVSTSTYGFAADAASGWKTTSQQVTVTANGGTGARTIHYSLDGGATWSSQDGSSVTFVVSEQGSHHVKYYASAASGTESMHDAGYVNIDSVAPVTGDNHLTASLLAPATVTLTPYDGTSGMSGGSAKTEYKVVGATSYTSGTSVVLGSGTHTVAYRSTDKAGNVESPDKTFTVTVNTAGTATSASTYRFAASATSGWTRRPPTVAITAAGGADLSIHVSLDGGATWEEHLGAACDVVVDTDGAHHVLFYAQDSTGVEATHDAGWVNLDTARPVTTAARAAVRKGARVKLKYRVTDATPGCGAAILKLQIRKRSRIVRTIPLGTKATNVARTYRYRARLKVGTYTWRILATDLAGNISVKMASARLVVR